ncbi:MAG: sigma-54-dependent Fis family transcriptional regulator [Gammaproteobacteria bacterium]|nr:MAG: sigma-54-dependent Fis family transcriptional regulator [Gammaproteobacteria bacterium]
MNERVLLIEDDVALSRLMRDQLHRQGYQVDAIGRWQEVADYFEHKEPHLVLADARLPDANTLEHLPWLSRQAPVIVLTAYGSVRDAVEAMHAGAEEYLVKPVNPDELSVTVRRVLEYARLRNEHQYCRTQATPPHYMVGDSPALRKMQQMIEAVAPTDTTVLIQGESGSGKELVARAIHDMSERRERIFVPVDCCTIQEKLFESELFGHERGAFTGADRRKKGLIEAAEGGTLFLDEIGEIEPAIQAKLLRVLETGQFRRLGSVKDLIANTRIVAATNRDLEAMSQDGDFRADLYYRLSVFVIEAPPLRERREDIPALVQHFIANHDFSRRIQKTASPQALEILMDYDWPGNIRELRNVMERAIILSGNSPEILPQHLTLPNRLTSRASDSGLFESEPSLEAIERRYLEFLLERYKGKRAKVAEVMGISERNLYRLIKRHGLK